MQRRNLIIIVAVLVVGLAAAGALAWNAFFTVPEPSGEVTAIPVGSQADDSAEPAESGAEQSEAQEPEAEDAASEDEADASQRTYTIVKDESEVRFQLGEILFGEPKTVIGTNSEFAAQILVDFDQPQNSQVGIVQINARTFTTDSSNRNGAINNRILESGTYEFITFAPTAYIGLPESIEVGQTVEFQVVGDLTIRDITNEATFDVRVTLVSEERLEGFASSSLQRGDYNLVIPSVPQVADVDEEVILEMDFIATAD